jgi:hypothetical protein
MILSDGVFFVEQVRSLVQFGFFLTDWNFIPLDFGAKFGGNFVSIAQVSLGEFSLA